MIGEDLFLDDDSAGLQAQTSVHPEPVEGPAFTPQQYATLERLTQLKALLAVNKVRIEQCTIHGHTDESDADEPIFAMLRAARSRVDGALERLTLGRDDQMENIEYARRYTVKAAALLLAQIDRFDAILESQQRMEH